MKLNHLGIQNDTQSVSHQARLLLSERRHKQQNRQQTMLHRAASEVGIEQ